ncbi:MAG: hypothetical protein M3O41_05465 [Pseudomonadota bacterium]|nr:hypothetical protein [Pseudomonadota bacterium]
MVVLPVVVLALPEVVLALPEGVLPLPVVVLPLVKAAAVLVVCVGELPHAATVAHSIAKPATLRLWRTPRLAPLAAWEVAGSAGVGPLKTVRR